jgi:uncharacterized membrane protein YkoI
MKRKHWKLAGMVVLIGVIVCVMTYAVIQDNNQKVTMTENGDGEEEITLDQAPAAVQATIQAEAQGGTIKEIERETENGKTVYEAEVIINGQEVEIEVASDGTLLGKEVEDMDDDEDGDDDDEDVDDDDEDEEEVTLDEAPAAVQATILKHAQGGTIEEIERETEDGQVVYEAEVEINGKEYEIEVAADGTLLEIEEDDD